MSAPAGPGAWPGLAAALDATLAGGRVQDVVVAGPDLLVLIVRLESGRDAASGRMRSLGLSLMPGAAGPLVLERRVRRDAEAEAPLLALLEAARSALEGGTLTRVEVPAGQSVLVFCFERAGEVARLALILFGAQPNAAVLRGSDVVADARGRFGPGHVEEAPWEPRAAAAPDENVERLDLTAWSEALLATRAFLLSRQRLDAARRRLEAGAVKAAALVARRESDVSRLPDPAVARRAADALAAHLHLVRRGMTEVRAPGFGEDGGALTLLLDPALDPPGNLKAAYARAAKSERGLSEAKSRLAEAVARREILETLRQRLHEADDDATREAIAGEVEALLPARTRAQAAAVREVASLPYRRFVSLDGLEILVGKSAAANVTLTFGIARGNDIWLHARGVAGSHVIVRMRKGAEIPQETLLDAATLAHRHSKRRDEPAGEVTWALVKDVSRRRGMAPGAVLVARERVIHLVVETGREARLEATRT